MTPSLQAIDLRHLLTRASALLMVAVATSSAVAGSSRGDDTSSLQFARKTFATADADMDGSLSAAEAKVAGIPEREFAARDKDKSGSWSREEFLFYYRDLLLNSGKRPDKEFQNEVARIEALRRAQAAEELRRARERMRKKSEEVQAASDGPATGGSGGEESISQKLKRAREALKDRSKRAGADRGAVERTAGGLAERARAAAGGADDEDVAESDWATKLRRARAALERRAKEGRWSREQLQAAERRLIERARAGQQGVDLTLLSAPVRSKYERALVALSDRAEAGDWTREKYEAELADLLARAKKELNDQGSGGSTGAGDADEGAAGSDGESARARRDYERALAALEERAVAGGWTRERYEAEREELAQRLRIRETGGADESSAAGQGQAAEARSKVERAQEVLDDRARRAGMDREQHARITEGLYERARQALHGVTVGANDDVRRKYERALTELIKRAQDSQMTRAAFEHKRDQILERARQEAGADMATQEDFDQARKTLVAELAKATSAIRTKYSRALLALISRAQKAGMTRAAFAHERDQLIVRSRQEASAGAVSGQDYDQARKALNSVVGGSQVELRTKHERALSALISRAQKAGMTRAAFEQARDQLLERARQEAATGGDEGAKSQGSRGEPGVRARKVETATGLPRVGRSSGR